jgi:hypothetical protein
MRSGSRGDSVPPKMVVELHEDRWYYCSKDGGKACSCVKIPQTTISAPYLPQSCETNVADDNRYLAETLLGQKIVRFFLDSVNL